MEIDAAGLEAGRGCDRIDAGARDTVAGDFGGGGIEQALAGAIALRCLARI